MDHEDEDKVESEIKPESSRGDADKTENEIPGENGEGNYFFFFNFKLLRDKIDRFIKF